MAKPSIPPETAFPTIAEPLDCAAAAAVDTALREALAVELGPMDDIREMDATEEVVEADTEIEVEVEVEVALAPVDMLADMLAEAFIEAEAAMS
jgi:hypothetical protein